MTYRPDPDEEFSPRAEHARIPYARKRTPLRTLLLGLAALCVAVYAASAILPANTLAPNARAAEVQAAEPRNVTPEEVTALMQQRKDDEAFMVIDVRTPAEFAEGHLANARNFDVKASDFNDRIGSLNRNRTYVVYCRSGNRSGKAVDAMRDMGFTSILHMNGGMLAWDAAKLPVEKP
ncbi:MAG: rhodanese-like domain-containing protein [Desulfovibrio sp.]|jgi:rhodanese-related sulfurtransferase|nr:rhodanese-like domain-containing protein [Desulfovibrio sp.]